MRVFVTGGGGFIGSHLVDSQLAQGHLVRTVDLHAKRLEHVVNHPCLEIVTGDVRDTSLVRQLVAGIDIVFHLASAHLDASLPDAYYRRVNVEATLNLLEAAAAAGVRRVVHCSSVGVIGDVESPPADERSPCRPTNIYEQTKLEGERAALEFGARTGFPVVVVRPAWVYGPRCPRTQRLLETIGKGRFVFFGNGRNLRHPIFIQDAIHGLGQCAHVNGIVGEVYIIAGPRPVTVRELVQTAAEVQGIRPPRLRLPLWLGIVAGHGLQLAFRLFGKQPPFSRRSLDFFLKDNAYDISKARRDLGFSPQVDLRSGLQQTLAGLAGT